TRARCPTSSNLASRWWSTARSGTTAYSAPGRCSRSARRASRRSLTPNDPRLPGRGNTAGGPRHGRLLGAALVLGRPARERDLHPDRTPRLLRRGGDDLTRRSCAGGGAADARLLARLRRRAHRPLDSDRPRGRGVLRRAGRFAALLDADSRPPRQRVAGRERLARPPVRRLLG